jgi:hypothetical protein
VVAPRGQNHSKSTGKIHVHNGERYIKRLKTIQKKKSVPLITEKRLQTNRELLIGQKIKWFFPGHGGALGTVKKYSVSNDTYYLTSAHWWSSRVKAFSWYTSSLSDNLTKLMINGNTGKWSRSKMCLVVRVWLILVGSNWNIKLGYLSDITLVLWWKGTFERMISTFWASKGWFRPFEPLALTFSHVTARLASSLLSLDSSCMTVMLCVLIISAPVPVPKRVCVKSDSRISSQGWWVSRVAVRNLWPQAVDESFLLSSPRNAHSNWTCQS